MRVKSITIYKPDGNNNFYAEGAALMMEGKELVPRVTIDKIQYNPLFKEVYVCFSNGEQICYHGMPVSYEIPGGFFRALKQLFFGKKRLDEDNRESEGTPPAGSGNA